MDILSYILSKQYTDKVVGDLLGFEIKVLDSLPQTGKSSVFYLVPAAKTKTKNIYNEFIWVASTNSFEQVGSTEIDLTGYATEEWVTKQGYLTEHQSLSKYALKSELFSKSYDDLTDKPTIPTKTSELINDSHFLTEHQDISGKADADHIHEEYALVDHKHEEYLTEHQSLEGYAKTTDLPNVSNFITMSEVEAKKYLTQVPSEYVTESELNNKGYLTEHQSLEEYALKSDLFSKSYNDLADTPVIPTATSQLTNDSEFISRSEVISLIESYLAENNPTT